ncbi:hypothetical protein AK812_SmicGene16103 [Symbiodinium microadriaticum]|uniref:Uncharacterized protein n=1 Tax=Symbiodinium microadriaticum TaxID=2951 RepID=A0A1Q9DN44_SYMMI|nr:hypothetical protein AK812_SmicGene21158 [Symbiodinium microadriaticum]OLQ01174.1 hypothetical protein AK812_SmicGene16103 [Symbiodinium microadriaticum]
MSGTAEQSSTHVGRTKDGIPTWGGEASAFVQYEEAALLWEQSLTWEKRYTAGPKLVQELTGAAKRLVSGQPPGWVSFRGGVTTLMDHLRAALGKPRINEVTDLLAAYFKGTKRKPQESMNDYITRKTEAYMRANQSLRRVQPHYEKTAVTSAGDRRLHQPRGSNDSTAWTWSRQWTPATEEPDTHTGDGEGDVNTEASTQPPEQGDHSWWEPRGWENRWDTWSWSSWRGYSGSYWDESWRPSSWSSAGSSTTSSSQNGQRMELLPQFIQGWYLLIDANLDAGERNLVMTALGGNFEPLKVAQELRNQFSEHDIRRRDMSRRHQSYMGENMDEDDVDTEAYNDHHATESMPEGMSEEGLVMMADADEMAHEAMATLMTAKRCGVKGHRVAQCPHKPLGEYKGQSNLAETGDTEPQQAPFVCYANKLAGFASSAEDHAAWSAEEANNALSTAEAVKRGMAVLDGGATQTIGSVAAVEAVMLRNQATKGSSGLRGVNSKDPPTFTFGNSSENRCLSTARLQISAGGHPGEMQIHTLEGGESPILMSIETLRKIGAIIDFEHDLAVFRKIDATKVLRLTRGKSGHQLLPLTEDWMSDSVEARQPVPSLAAYLPA